MPMRHTLTTIAELVGLATASVGVFLLNAAAGLIFVGLALVLVGALEGRR
jgi:hypothetical protein